jgi:hypothetical protein
MSGREEEMDEREGGLAAALDQIRSVDIDEAAVRALTYVAPPAASASPA